MRYWELIADKLSAAGWSCGYCSAVIRDGWRWIVDAHREDGRRYIVHLTSCSAHSLNWKQRYCNPGVLTGRGFYINGSFLGTLQGSDQADGQSQRSNPGAKSCYFPLKQELDPDGIPQFGLVAEEVEKVNPDLIVRGEDGKVMTVRYEAVNAMLLNEFLKEHRKVEEQQNTIADLKATLAQQQKELAA
jgi:hypothetical protein